jgi:NADH kinase
VQLIKILRQNNAEVFVEEDSFIDLKPQLYKESQPIDLMVTVGGDGTVLYCFCVMTKVRHGMSIFQEKKPPLLFSFGRGTLGFMCVYDLKNYEHKIRELMNGNYTIE